MLAAIYPIFLAVGAADAENTWQEAPALPVVRKAYTDGNAGFLLFVERAGGLIPCAPLTHKPQEGARYRAAVDYAVRGPAYDRLTLVADTLPVADGTRDVVARARRARDAEHALDAMRCRARILLNAARGDPARVPARAARALVADLAGSSSTPGRG